LKRKGRLFWEVKGVKRSLSNLIKGEDPPSLTIGSFKAQEIPQSRHDNSPHNQGGQADLQPLEEDPSVSSWDFPIVEKRERDSDRLARLEKEAYEKGFEQGQKDGLALEEMKIREMGKQLKALFSGLNDLKPQVYSESEGELLKLSLLIAKKIIGEEVRTNNEIIGNTISSALKFLTDKRKVKIIINSDDMEDVRRLLPDLAKLTKGGHFQITEDNSIKKGGCILETGFGKINATIEDQLGMLEEEIEQQFHSIQEKFHETLP
jgi:flagellar assembly protein FliH